MSGNPMELGTQTAKLRNDLTPELKDKEQRGWRGDELMSEEQARRLREVSRKRNLKAMKRFGNKPVA